VRLYSSKPDLHLCIHSVSGLGSRRLIRTRSASDGGWDHGDDDGQRSLHSDRLGARVFCDSKKFSHDCDYNPIPCRQTPVTPLQVGHGLACVTLFLSLYAPKHLVDVMRGVRYQLHVIGAVARRVYYHDKLVLHTQKYEDAPMPRKLFSANPSRIGRFDGPLTSDIVPASLVDGTPGELTADLVALLE
jgi:hypothetical protein